MTDLRETNASRLEVGDATSVALRAPLGRVEARRDELAKEWLIAAIREAPLSDAHSLPFRWATEDLPELITEVLVAVCDGGPPVLGRSARERARELGALRPGLTPSKLSEDLSRLQSEVVRSVIIELGAESDGLRAEATSRIARVFGLVAGEAHEALIAGIGPEEAFVHGMKRPDGLRRRIGHLVEAYRRHDKPFALTLFDVEGPGSDRVDVVATELRRGIRSMDETYRLEENELCVLSPFQVAADGARMAERLASRLAELDRHERWELTVSAGVASCPEHGDDPDALLAGADTAMWRARATGRPVAVADSLAR